MKIQSLNGNWQFRQHGTEEWLPAVVPGCVHTDLLALGRIHDPFVGTNERDVQWIGAEDWEYVKEFDADEALFNSDRVQLICQGLDTIADVSFNGQPLGHADNMFRTFEWEVKALLKPGQNRLPILFHSPVKYIQEKQRQRPLPAGVNVGSVFIRKVQSHFGWDWGPTLPSCGIWQDIFLQGQSLACLKEIHLTQHHSAQQVTLGMDCHLSRWNSSPITLAVTLRHPDGQITQTSTAVNKDSVAIILPIESPQLWWPNGLGDQPLYHLEIRLLQGEALLDSRNYQIGLRKLELRQEPDAWGKTFTFVINDVPIFAKGADWIPADSFITRLTHSPLEHLLQSCVQANMNMLRVWGGGFYESEDFYDLCDQYGILIWQDCGFACAAYPLDTPEFLENVKAEISENIRRLRHRASLALWCGNNEIESMWRLWQNRRDLTRAYEHFFHHTLPDLVSAIDPDHPYWPSSPSSNQFRVHTNGDALGDTHLWHVWHGLRPFTYFRKRFTRFCSEFGLESLPSLPTIASFAKPDEYSLKSDVFLHHQRSAGGNDKMLYYLTSRFRIPANFADMVYLTQIDQAECMRTGVEHWRRNRPRCSGALYWQLNDCWPVSSWASIDYFGRWKALQYAARRFYAPLSLSLEENGTRVTVHVANDRQTEFCGEIRYSLQTFSGEEIASGNQIIKVQKNLSSSFDLPAFKQELHKYSKKSLVLVVSLFRGSEKIDTQIHLFAPEKFIHLPDPELTLDTRLENDTLVITLTAKKLARFVEVSLTGSEGVFSDNFFDLPASASKEITCPLPPHWTLAQAQAALHVHSLADVQAQGSLFTDLLEHYRTGLTWISLKTRVMFTFTE